MALRVASEAAVHPTFIIGQTIVSRRYDRSGLGRPGVAVRATAEKATVEAIAVLETIFVFHLR
jgi:hypothetical protein